MFKKLNSKTLLFIFGGLLALVVVVQLVQRSKGERNFKEKFFEVDTARVSAIIINQHGSKEEVRIARNGKLWTVTIHGQSHKAEKSFVQSILSEIAAMKPDRVAGDKSDWKEYLVTDSAATRVKVEQDGKKAGDFFLGKMTFQQQYQQTSYLRMEGEEEVYAVNGYISMMFNRDAEDFCDKSMIMIANMNDITRLTFSYPDSSFLLKKDNNSWKIDGEKADSTKVAGYLGSIVSLNGSGFVDNKIPTGKQVLSLKVEGKNFQPVEVKAMVADTVNRYAITSSTNPDVHFSGTKGDLANRVFVAKNHFKASPKKKEKLAKSKKK